MNKKNYPCRNLSLEDIPGEKWKELPEIGESYLVSNYGRIKSLPKYVEVFTPKNGRSICYWTKERIRKIKIHTKWNSIVEKPYYECTVSLHFDGVEKAFMIHRLVYSAFIKAIDFNDDKLFVTHKDGDALNNWVENLEATHRSESLKKSYSQNRHISPFAWKSKNEIKQISARAALSREKPVIQKDLEGHPMRRFKSIAEASRSTGIPDSNIVAALKKRVSQAGRSRWEYLVKTE